MDFEHNKDPFKECQPEIEFLDELHGPVYTALPAHWNCRQAAEGEVLVRSAVICANFPDVEGVLETAYADFGEFLELAGVMAAGEGFRFRTARDAGMPQEAYRITVNHEECLI